jgi:Skp family chaperone for outer membrane proteins
MGTKYIFLIVILFGFFTIIQAQKGVRVGYIDMDIILDDIDEYKTANDLLDNSIDRWRKEIELKKIQLKQIQDQLSFEKILLTPELIQDRELEIQDFAIELINLQEKRFGTKGDMIIQKTKLLQPIQDQVLNIVQQIAKEKKYDFIFDRSSDPSMLYSVKNYDISDLVLKRINRQQKIQKRKDQIGKIKKN